MKYSDKEKRLLRFIRQQNSGKIIVKVSNSQPQSFERDMDADWRTNYERFCELLKKYNCRLYWNFFNTEENLLKLCEFRYRCTPNTLRTTVIRYKLNCPYYLYCQTISLSYPSIPDLESKVLRMWKRKYPDSDFHPRMYPGKVVLPNPDDVFGENCVCKNCSSVCEICGEQTPLKKIKVHHLKYISEAIPNETNLDWLQYYQLTCTKCHVAQRGKVSGYKDWNHIVVVEHKRLDTEKRTVLSIDW